MKKVLAAILTLVVLLTPVLSLAETVTIGVTGAFPDAIRFYKKYPAVAKRLITELLPFDAERIGTAMQRRATTSLKAVISLQELP